MKNAKSKARRWDKPPRKQLYIVYKVVLFLAA